jgi:cell division protein FtsQ
MVVACGRVLRKGLPAIIMTCVIAAVGAGLVWGYDVVTTSERFAIADIQIHGTSRLTADEVRAALPIATGENVFSADLDDAAARLRRHPWIASADVRRVLPRTIIVDIREYEAVAVVALGELYLVDASGHAFKRAHLADDSEVANLPIVTGIARADYLRDPTGTAAEIVAALAVFARWRADDATRPAIGEIHVGHDGGISLRAYTGDTSFELGNRTTAVDLQVFDAVWAELSEPERARVRTIHLDARDHVTVAFKD